MSAESIWSVKVVASLDGADIIALYNRGAPLCTMAVPKGDGDDFARRLCGDPKAKIDLVVNQETKEIAVDVSQPAIELAEKALHALGAEDLLYAHHMVVHARPEAYARLAEFFEQYARRMFMGREIAQRGFQ